MNNPFGNGHLSHPSPACSLCCEEMPNLLGVKLNTISLRNWEVVIIWGVVLLETITNYRSPKGLYCVIAPPGEKDDRKLFLSC